MKKNINGRLLFLICIFSSIMVSLAFAATAEENLKIFNNLEDNYYNNGGVTSIDSFSPSVQNMINGTDITSQMLNAQIDQAITDFNKTNGVETEIEFNKVYGESSEDLNEYYSEKNKENFQNNIKETIANNPAISTDYNPLPNPSDFIVKTDLTNAIDNALTKSGITAFYALLLKIGFAVALIVLAVYGVCWIISTPAKKAELKQSIAPIVIAIFILTAGIGPATMVAQTVLGFFENTGGTEEIILTTTQTVFHLIRTLGVAISILVILTIGIEWLFANPQKRAELKGKLVNIVIGLAILLGAVTILSFLENVFAKV